MKVFVSLIVAVALVVAYWKVALVLLLVVLAVKALPVAYREFQAERAEVQARRRAIVARADQQLQWWLDGDERATYGHYPPAC